MDDSDTARRSDTEEPIESAPEDAEPPYLTVSADAFLDTFLPKVPEVADSDAMDSIVNWVVTESGEYANDRWKSFTLDPSEYRQPNATVFRKLCGIVDAIHNAVGQCLPELHSKLKTQYYTWPSNVPEKTRPDGCFVLDNERSRGKDIPGWMDSAVTGHFEKDGGTSAIRDNTANIIRNMDRVFLEDPRRRHTFGYTIENRTLRMWSASRSGIVVSSPVDFFKEPAYIIHFFFASMYASPTEMGWDPTMKTIWDGDTHVEPQYDITVQSKEGLIRVFRTVSLISAVGAESICGRGTRVWMVREVVGDDLSDETYVLKDTWIDSDRLNEGEIIAQIKADAAAELNETDRERLLDFLLTIFIYGDVMVDPGRRDEAVGARGRGAPHSALGRSSTTPTPPSTSTPLDALGHSKKGVTIAYGGSGRPAEVHDDSSDTKKTDENSIPYGRKVHFRIVFKEACSVLHEIKSLEDIIHVLVKTCGALQILHKLGWVHRDISSGNLMMKNGQLKIADFEYAKKMTKPGGEINDIRTGTEDFMSIEVRRQMYLFTTDKEEDDDDRDVWGEVYGDVTCEDVEDDTETEPRHTWFYNPLHDFESVLWLTLNFLINKDFRCVPSSPKASSFGEGDRSILGFLDESDAQRKERIIAHWNFGQSIFAGRSGRAELLYSSAILTDFLGDYPLHPALAPLGKILINMRNALVCEYRRIERNPSLITHQSAPEISKKFAKQLLTAYKHVQRIPCRIEIRSLKQAIDALPKSTVDTSPQRPQPSTSKGTLVSPGAKRRRDDDDGEYAEGSQARKSKRTSASHISPALNPATAEGRKVKRRSPKGMRARTRHILPTSAPFTSHPATAPPEHTPLSPHRPPTRVLRSQTCDAVMGAQPTQLGPPLDARTRGATVATAVAAKNQGPAIAAAKVARKLVGKAKPRTRKGRRL